VVGGGFVVKAVRLRVQTIVAINMAMLYVKIEALPIVAGLLCTLGLKTRTITHTTGMLVVV
jgi:hypothetical protein